jgi:hypothetical protein
MEKNLIIEINRNLQLMNLNKKNLLTEQKYGFIDDIAKNLRKIIDNKPPNETKWTSPSGREFDYSQIESLIRGAEELGDDLTQDLVWARDFVEMFPNDAYNAVLEDVEKDAVEELLNYFKRNNITDIDEIKETVSGFIKNNMGLEGDSAEMAEALLSETLSNKIYNHIQSRKSIDEFPYVTNKAKGIDVSDARSATDDVTSGGARRSDIEIEDVELETVSKNKIDPNNNRKLTDGREIRMYDADGNPRVEKLKPKEAEPIPTNPDEPRLQDPTVKPTKTLTNIAEELENESLQFMEKNKKLFDSLIENFKKLDDPNLSRKERVKIENDNKKTSKILSRKWNRTFLNFKGEKSFKEMIQWLEISKRSLSKEDKVIIDEVINHMKKGLPEDFFVDKSRWRRFIDGLKKFFKSINSIKQGTVLGFSDDTFFGPQMKRLYREIKAKFNAIKTKNTDFKFDKMIMVDTVESVLSTPNVVRKIKRLKEARKSKTLDRYVWLREVVALITGVLWKSLKITVVWKSVQTIYAIFNDNDIQSTLEKWEKDGYKPTEKEKYELIKMISIQSRLDYDLYKGDHADAKKLVGNVLDELDYDEWQNWFPFLSRLEIISIIWDVSKNSDYAGSSETEIETMTKKIMELITPVLEPGGVETIGALIEDDDEFIKEFNDENVIEAMERIKGFLERYEKLTGEHANLNLTSVVMSQDPRHIGLFEKIVGEFEGEKSEDEVRELINKYIKYNEEEERYEFKCGQSYGDGYIAKKDLKWGMTWNDGSLVYPFKGNLKDGGCKPISEWTQPTNESTGKKGYTKHKGLITILEQANPDIPPIGSETGDSGDDTTIGDEIRNALTGLTGPTYKLEQGNKAIDDKKTLYDEVINKLKDGGGEQFVDYIVLWKNVSPNPDFGVTYENPPSNEDEIVYGQRKHKNPTQGLGVNLYVIRKNTSGEFELYEYDPDSKNLKSTPTTTITNMISENLIKKYIMEELEKNSLSQMIDNKLREFNFYSANDKGKQKVVFTDEDREEISREFDDLIKKYPEDIAFIRAVVIAKGEDKKTGEPIIRLGSYYNNADIELPFNSQMNGLGKLLDGGIIYFTVINNEGPDYRDFKIVGGDKIPEVEFNEPEKEEIALDNYTHGHEQEMEEMDEPFEEVMKKKEQQGLSSLLEKGDVTNDLTKRQKEVLENLKKKGFKLSKPENADIYERVRVNSKEFNESIKAWKPKGK